MCIRDSNSIGFVIEFYAFCTIRWAVSYTHLRAHETDSYLVCRLLLEKKVNNGEAKVGFALFATQMENVISFADKKLNMPPKSTWFDPKPLDGLVAYDFE